MIRIVYVIAVFLLAGAVQSAVGQQDPQFSLYVYNPLYYNPAAAGSEGVSRAQITHRTQYLGYQPTIFDDGGSQNTQLVSFNMPLARIKSGIGIYAFNDALAANFNQSVQLAYAYRATLKNGTLSVGVQAGVYNKGYDYSSFRPFEPEPGIPTGRINQIKPDIGAGVYYNTTDYWLGVSVKHLNQASYSLIGDLTTDYLSRVAYLTAGYRLGLTYDIDVQPSVLVQYDTRPGFRAATIMANALATYQNRFWAGLGYRLQDAVMATVGANLGRNNALRFGYSFDFQVSGQSRAAKSATSHELLLAYALPAPDARKKPIVRTPRFRY